MLLAVVRRFPARPAGRANRMVPSPGLCPAPTTRPRPAASLVNRRRNRPGPIGRRRGQGSRCGDRHGRRTCNRLAGVPGHVPRAGSLSWLPRRPCRLARCAPTVSPCLEVCPVGRHHPDRVHVHHPIEDASYRSWPRVTFGLAVRGPVRRRPDGPQARAPTSFRRHPPDRASRRVEARGGLAAWRAVVVRRPHVVAGIPTVAAPSVSSNQVPEAAPRRNSGALLPPEAQTRAA